jgi:TolA-binding protein
LTGVWTRLAELPAAIRWGIGGGLGLLVLAVALSATWSWQERREAASQTALTPAVAAAHQALGSRESGALEDAARRLNQFLKDYPRSRAATQAWYLLGEVELQRHEWDASAAAFTEAARRDAGDLGLLSRLGQGHALEGKGEIARALAVYQQALGGLGPKDFLYGDLLLAKARALEQTKDSAGAIATYRQYLKDLPGSDQADEVRIRLGLLGVAG